MKEADVWQAVRTKWPEVHSTRIENTATFGTPDVNCACNGVEWWMELKLYHNGSTVIRHTQAAFIANRIRVSSDRNVFIFAANEKNGYLYESRKIFLPNIMTSYSGQIRLNLNLLKPLAIVEMTDRESWKKLLETIINFCLQK